MAEDNGCPVCGQHFAEEEDFENHKEQEHKEIKETYPEAFDKEEDKVEETIEDEDKEEAEEQEDEPPYIPDGVEPDEVGGDDKAEADEEGADEPLKKVDDLSEDYGKLDAEDKAEIFESLGLSQGDAYILANRSWSELTKELRKDASEAYTKEQEEEEEDKAKEQEEEEKEEDKAYESTYNLERKHNSPDVRTKVACENCNILFENNEDLSTHYNDTHAPADEFELEDEEDDYKVDPLPQGEGYDGI